VLLLMRLSALHNCFVRFNQLSDLLIKPVQRIMKYELLFKDVLKQTLKLGDRQDEVDSLNRSLSIMTVVPKDANDMMDVGR
jgi:RhoGEF domain